MNSINIAKRNTAVFFRDKTSVFFSLLAVFIIIGLYVLFLGNLMVQGGEFGEQTRFIMDSWIMAGIISITSITTTMGAFETMVSDKTSKVIKDFYASPVKRGELALGYILSSFFIGTLMCVAALVLAEVYILAYGGSLLPFVNYLEIFGVIILSVTASSSMMFFLVSFFNSTSAFATGSTVIGTIIGFITGIYIPIGQLPAAVQAVIKFFPISHSGALLRQIMMGGALENALGSAPGQLEGVRLFFGVDYQIGEMTVTPLASVAYLFITAVVFYALNIWRLSKKHKKA